MTTITATSTIPLDKDDTQRLAMIVAHVMNTLNVEFEELAGAGRRPQVVLARGMIAHLARRLAPAKSYPQIACAIGRPTHSTIIAAERRIDAMIEGEFCTINHGGEVLAFRDWYSRIYGQIEGQIEAAYGRSRIARHDAKRRVVPKTEVIEAPAEKGRQWNP